MIITRTPLRLSFFGGGTDYPDHYLQHGGQTLGVAIDKYSYISLNPLAGLFDYQIRVSYSRTELVGCLDAIEHPAVRECLRFTGIDRGIEIHYVGDLPARTGLGSSSSFTVALLHALHAFKGEHVSQDHLAHEACHVEQALIGERVGVQDQYTCSHGGLLHLRMATSGQIGVQRVPLPAGRLGELRTHLMLVYTGVRRVAHEVLEEQLDRTRHGVLVEDLRVVGALVEQGLEVLTDGGAISRFGELLDTAWRTKQRLSSRITSARIDSIYQRARAAGAIGGKLVGAGAGGFLVLFVPPASREEVTRALPELHSVSFDFDHTGSRLLFYQP